MDAGRFDAEIAPVTVRDAKGRETVVTVDEGPRRDSTDGGARAAQPAFALPDGEDRGDATVGTVTAGNAPGITDGAAATVVASERAVERHGLKPLARIVGYAQAEVAPKWLFLAPVQGVRRLLDRIELPIEAFDLIEINEAFAAQTLADGRELGFDWDKVNVNGGAIALGHPIGASGARIVATLLHELRGRDGRYGLATLCLGGGGSVAMARRAGLTPMPSRRRCRHAVPAVLRRGSSACSRPVIAARSAVASERPSHDASPSRDASAVARVHGQPAAPAGRCPPSAAAIGYSTWRRPLARRL